MKKPETKLTSYAEEAIKFFLRMCFVLGLIQTPRNPDAFYRFSVIGPKNSPYLLVHRRETEHVCNFFRSAFSLSFLFIGKKEGDAAANEKPLVCRQVVSNDAIVIEPATNTVKLTQQDMAELTAAYESTQEFTSEMLKRLFELVAPLEAGAEGVYFNNGDDIIAADEYAANILADLFDALCFPATTGYYDPVEDARAGSTDICTGKWYVSV